MEKSHQSACKIAVHLNNPQEMVSASETKSYQAAENLVTAHGKDHCHGAHLRKARLLPKLRGHGAKQGVTYAVAWSQVWGPSLPLWCTGGVDAIWVPVGKAVMTGVSLLIWKVSQESSISQELPAVWKSCWMVRVEGEGLEATREHLLGCWKYLLREDGSPRSLKNFISWIEDQ